MATVPCGTIIAHLAIPIPHAASSFQEKQVSLPRDGMAEARVPHSVRIIQFRGLEVSVRLVKIQSLLAFSIAFKRQHLM